MNCLVLIPHLPAGQQGHELTLAITGWRKYFKEDFTIALMGEKLPVIDGVINVESPRVPDVPGEYRQHLDYVSCARKARERFPDTKGFIVAGDDVFAVNDFTMEDVMVPKVMANQITTKCDKREHNQWWRNFTKTGRILKEQGYPLLNWTTHLPHYYEWDKLFSIYDRYDCDHSSYVIENLYYNVFPPEGKPVTIKRNDRWKYEVNYTPLNLVELITALSGKIWVNCTEHGWSVQMEDALAEHYGIKL